MDKCDTSLSDDIISECDGLYSSVPAGYIVSFINELCRDGVKYVTPREVYDMLKERTDFSMSKVGARRFIGGILGNGGGFCLSLQKYDEERYEIPANGITEQDLRSRLDNYKKKPKNWRAS